MNAKGGTAVIVDVQTGDVLAMAVVDGASDTQPAHVADAMANNRTVTDVYEPGSTNKVITMSGAIQEGIVNPDTVFDNVGQSINVGGTDYEDVEEHSSTMTVADILAQSSNVGTIEIAHELGATKLSQYLDAFGFGQPTGLNLPGESAGLVVRRQEGLHRHEHGVDPDRLRHRGDPDADARRLHDHRQPRRGAPAAAGRRDGRRRRQRHDEPLPAPHQVVSAATADAVTGMLKKVVTEGTGVKAQIPGYPVAGKTGTAKKVPYDLNEYNASFAGFAPADNPRLAAIVVMDSPQGSIFGADAAAPVFQQIMQFALTYERVPTS